MKTNIYCLASFAFIASFASFAFALEEEPYPGRLAPDFTLSDINGGQVNLSSLYSKGPVWMTIFTTWCDACKVETPLLIEASRKYGAVQFIAVSLMENAEDAKAFQKQYQIPYPVLADE
ncbi:MAG: TlpA family protein disulfide reductase, partial [Elusimicrobia bacterium]|nr:TlpA family protein disulfide reductase [Elusimicrobiota bacterium]